MPHFLLPFLLLASGALTAELDDLIQKGKDDLTTMVTYSLKVYYTPMVTERVKNISAFIDQMITTINDGYSNSKMPLRVVLHNTELTVGFDDTRGPERTDEELKERLTRQWFGGWSPDKSSREKIRQTADAAMIIVHHMRTACGLAWPGLARNHLTMVAWWCAGDGLCDEGHTCGCGKHCFAPMHELAHNFGLHHTAPTCPTLKDHHGQVQQTCPNKIFAQNKSEWRWMWPSAKFLSERRFAFAASGNESDKKCSNPN